MKNHVESLLVALASSNDCPDGLSLAQCLAQFSGVPRRSLQRQLAQAVSGGQLMAVGHARARRYVAVAPPAALTAYSVPPVVSCPEVNEPTQTGPARGFPAQLALSADSRDVAAYVQQPVAARQPVGYQREFLDSYQPNVTPYLSPSLCRKLHGLGQTAQAGAPAGTHGRAVLNRLLIDLSWASSHLEGNTYTRLDTRALIEQGSAAQGKAALETQMILNHKAAIELLVANADALRFDRYTLLNLHSALAENLLPNPADEGRVRQHVVDIGHSVYRPLSVPQQLNDLFDLVLHKASQIADPFEQSFFAMVHLPYLQPFADINKRTSRLAANMPLLKANLCPLTFLGVSPQAYSTAVLGVYEMTRVELLRDLYVWAYERSTQEYVVIQQNLAQPDPTRLAWRDVIKRTVAQVVRQPQRDSLTAIQDALAAQWPPGTPQQQRDDVQALVVEELQRLHEGVLARYGLRPSELHTWVAAQNMPLVNRPVA